MAVGVLVYGRCAGVGRGLGVGVARTKCEFTAIHCENSEVSSSVVSLHVPELPALKIDWISDCESARLNTSISSKSTGSGWSEPAITAFVVNEKSGL